MLKTKTINNNRGFSFIELVVIMAIMTIAVGTLVLSVSLLTGSEAKKAAKKIDVMLNEVQTGAMSRSDEDITVVYKYRNIVRNGVTASGEFEQDGFYAIKEIKTLMPSGTGVVGAGNSLRQVDASSRTLGYENRIVCDDRVLITLYYMDGATEEHIDLADDGTNSFTIRYKRETGKLDGVVLNGNYGNPKGIPTKIVMRTSTNSKRMYVINFRETGRHSLDIVDI